MKYYKFFFFFLFISYTFSAFTQQGKIEFSTKKHAFGKIKELNGPVSHTFIFSNQGSTSLRVKKVDVSCGCTTPEWSQGPIAPGDSGFITAEFDPENKPGEFEKYLTIHTDGTPSIDEIIITGFVEPKPKLPEDDFPYEYGNMRLKNKNFKIGLISNKKTISRSFDIFNQSETDTLVLLNNTPLEHIQLSLKPIPPKQRGELVLQFDPIKKNDFGSYLRDKIIIPISDSITKKVTVITSIEEYFPEMTKEELALSPNLSLSDTIIKLAPVKTGITTETSITIHNTGKSSLTLHKVFAACKCIKTSIDKTTLEPNESARLIISFDTTARSGKQSKTIMIYANSPLKPYSEVKLQTTVLE